MNDRTSLLGSKWRKRGGEKSVHVKGSANGVGVGLRCEGKDNSRVPRLWVSLFMFSLLMLLPMPLRASVHSGDNVTVTVLCLMRGLRAPSPIGDAIISGFNSSLAARNWTAARNVHVVPVSWGSYGNQSIDALDKKLSNKSELLVLLGPLSDRDVLAVTPLLEKHNVIAFAPVTGSSGLRKWTPHLYFLGADPVAELIALIYYALSQLRPLRLGLMHLHNTSYGEVQYELTMRLISRMGRDLCGVFALESSDYGSASGEVFNAMWSRFASLHPQGVLVLGPPNTDTFKFLLAVPSDERTKDMYILAPSALQPAISIIAEELRRSGKVAFASGQVIITGTNPLATDVKHHAVRRFQKEMRSYLKAQKNESSPGGEDHFLKHATTGKLAVLGWVAGETLLQALSNREWLTSREEFKKSLYNQRRYVIDDLVIGDYGGECTGSAAAQGATCRCNQGGHVIYMNRLEENGNLSPLADGLITRDVSGCYSDSGGLHAPLIGLFILTLDDPIALRAATIMRNAASVSVSRGHHEQSNRLFMHTLPALSDGLTGSLQQELNTRTVTAVFGVVHPTIMRTPGLAFIDPVPLTPQLNRRMKNVIHLSPTLEQQLFVLAAYISSSSGSGVRAVIRGEDSNAIGDVLTRTLATFGVTPHSLVTARVNETIEGALPVYGNVFIIGLTASDVGSVVAHMERNPDVHVLVPFFDVVLLYDEVLKAFNGSSSANRLLIATNLPHWAEVHSSSEIVQGFHAALPDPAQWTPLALVGFAAARVVRTIIPRIEKVTGETVINLFYNNIGVSAGDMYYGPFNHGECVNDDVDGLGDGGCAVNYGATRISVWSMARVLNASVPALALPVTPSMQYHDPNAAGSTGSTLIGIVVGSLFTVFLFVAIVVCQLYFAQRSARDNGNAPKELSDPVTLVFTDIESSTAQWSAYPELMPDAVDLHHRLIRSLIVRYNCYEVKTVGDSFMIACKDPFAAVQLAHDLQRTFLHHNWGTTAFDELYRDMERRRAEEEEGYTPPSAHLDPNVYDQLWSGLRVRVGIHTGLCEIRNDEVTKGYDYYGHTSNMAARTEGVADGGQVLMTRATYMSLRAEERRQFDVTALAPVELRGVNAPVEIWQLNAVPGRIFAALDIDKDTCVFGDSSEGSISSGERGLSGNAITRSAQTIVDSLNALLGTFTAAQRRKALMPFCERWRVALPPEAGFVWSDDYCRQVIHIVAAKVGKVIDHTVVSQSTGRSTSIATGQLSDIDGFTVTL
ncbi:receptor-type adenylate cyclase GRESAG 4,putative [Trypanosoma brucei gambiense DAL972]|uniref:adenylate cyclase n=1 Tax=Trypanosoma brucei gambiense (strain MHOM/CI/86/DAL972) TaxID=679716 RepID=C9ZNT1_TRYB9|nr:receptor-type adenylate cyclase GRESAG 4,putative [Trypanosoma brucei gambiense DAL972]CBH11059.1 receptor-type adenylate cyclase GRESAG 4,putative [Trypanosoma brucei gambiense DAL972]|eukprot:XP_011773346.1 receptor-type adenylate cyclase GRESAG 4,putative [Trypanosoma brucei gambiense DAL972]